MSEQPVILGLLACAISGVPGLFCGRSAGWGQWIAALLMLVGAGIGLVGVACYWRGGDSAEILLAWPVPGGQFRVAVDGISAMFLVPIFLIAALGSIYGLSYWKQSEHPENGRKLCFFYGLTTASMALLVIARNGLLFLAGWELVALTSYFLVTTENRDDVRRAGWVYLAATHVSTLLLFALFALLKSATGSYDLRPLTAAEISPTLATVVFVLALVGFGLKAGIMPFHVWLPSAHAMSPSHISALMSGVIIKMGIYGLVRVVSFLPHPPLAWGVALLALGGVSGVLGIAYAIGQHDLKRLLAYSSIENIGIIVMGLGLALIGRSLARVDWIVLGLAGALLHVWNHALFKSLMFFSAGSLIHATGTREIDSLGGLAKAMPRTAACFLVGAVAVCGLPPLNGFVSEFLIYLGLFSTLGVGTGSTFTAGAFAAPALALIGTLAVACFVKVYGAVFLGSPRTDKALHAHESNISMIGPMAVLAACCLLIGLAPLQVAPLLTNAAQSWAVEVPAAELTLSSHAPLPWIGRMGLLLVAVIALLGLALATLLRRSRVEAGPTWGCGYAAPTPRMQYTESSFAEMIVGLFGWALRPKVHRPGRLPLFPQATSFHSEISDVALDEAVLPAFRGAARFSGWFRFFQQGNVHAYLLYIFVTLLALLLSAFTLRRRVMEIIVDNLTHLLIALAFPPLLLGVIGKTKALFAGRIGPPLLQPYWDLIKLFRKGSVFSDTTTWVFRAGPVIGLATSLVALLLIPLGGRAAPVSFAGDLILLAYLFGLGRFFTATAALDTGSPFEGMGAAREVSFACLAEPAFFFGLLVLVKLSGSLQLGVMLGGSVATHWATAGASLALVLLSWFVVLLVENCRVPFDDPNTHLELTMIHEVMVLDHSGPSLGLILYGAALKLFAFSALVVHLAVPLSGGSVWLDRSIFLGATLLVAVAVGVVESTMARLKMTHIPILLVAACLLSAFGIILVPR